MPTTPNGLGYPDSSAHTRIWDHLHDLASAVDSRYGLTVANVAALSAVPTPFAGMRVFCTAEKILAGYDGVKWFPLSPNEAAVNMTPAAANTMTNPTTYQTLPNAPDRTLATTTMTKVSAGTTLIVSIDCSINLASGASQGILAGLKIGGVNVDIARRLSAAASVRIDLHGVRRVGGIPAGALTIEPIFASTTAASLIVWPNDDQVSYHVRESV